MPTTGALRLLAAHRTVEAGVAERKHPAVGGNQPVALTVAGGRNADDRRVEVLAAHGALEGGITEGEDPAVAGHQPVALAVGRRGDADDRRVEVLATHGALEGRRAIGEHAAIACCEHGALARRRGEGQLFDEGAESGVTVAVGIGQRAAVGQASDARHAADGIEEAEGSDVRTGLHGPRRTVPVLHQALRLRARAAVVERSRGADRPARRCAHAGDPGQQARRRGAGHRRRRIGPRGTVPVLHEDPRGVPARRSVVAPEAQQSVAPTHSRPLR